MARFLLPSLTLSLFMAWGDLLAQADSVSPNRPATPQNRPHPEMPLPAGVNLTDPQGRDNGVRFVDLDGDGHADIVFANEKKYGIYLYNTVSRKDLGWERGWTNPIREGVAGDAFSLPPITSGKVVFQNGAMWVDGKKTLSFKELCRPATPPPRTPAESLKAIQVKAGFRAELVAFEPLVKDPIFIDWDARGRMWVVEMADYPFHEYKGQIHKGRVKFLEDTDGDGVYDKSTTFLDDLTYPTGLSCWQDGVFVATVPEVIFAQDTDGDGRADKRTTILKGFTKGNPQHLMNGFAWGLDGWLYGGNGDSGGLVTDLSTGKKHNLGGRDFRFNPRTGEFQLQAGRSQYGRWRDDYGNWFANTNNQIGWHYLFDEQYLVRNPNLALATVKQNLNVDGTRMYPVSPPMRRFNHPGAVNLITSACNLIPYRDDFFGPEYAKSVFICEPANNLVHREVLYADGVSFHSQRAHDEKESEFLASKDNWSRFTQARTGPDGCLYVVDMYRLVIEHPEWIPKQIIENIDLRAGCEMGRIYRVIPQGSIPRAIPNLSKMTDADLGKALQSSNGWVRDTAHRLLLERRSQWKTSQIAGSIGAGIHQLWAMTTLGTLDPPLLREMIGHQNPFIREQAFRVAGDYLGDEGILTRILEGHKDVDLRVRVQAVFTLGMKKDARIPTVLKEFAKRDGATTSMLVALLSSDPDHPDSAEWKSRLIKNQLAGSTPSSPKIVSHINPDRARIVKDYASVSTMTGDATRGHALFTTSCSACHRLKKEGFEIGPDLGTIANKPTEQIIEGILDPNRAVEQRYLAEVITLKNGKLITGLIIEETANSFTIRGNTSTEVILRNQVEKTEKSSRSIMPDGMESILNPQQMADLLAWIRSN